MPAAIDWTEALRPLLKKYRKKPHPLEHKNLYQLLVMVVLSAQSSDKLINAVAPDLFKAYPGMKKLSMAKPEDLFPFISKVRGFRKKAEWLVDIAREVKDDKKIPVSMEGLTSLPGIGRKSANVILRGAGVKAEGVIVDLHVVRVAPRLGITQSNDPKKIEKDIMEALPQKHWGEIGMAISFLGREICRPKNPLHGECPVRESCAYFQSLKKR